MAAISEIDRQIRELHTERLLKIANKLIVPIPSFSDETAWEELSPYRKICLTNKGIFELKKSIRLEKKERRDIVFSLITILIGLIGALIGLISVLKN